VSRIRPLAWKYNTELDTKISDFLPVIGSQIPNKLLTYFDNNDYNNGLVYFGTETAPAIVGKQNQNKSYRSDGCLNLNFNAAQNQHKSVWIDFTKIAGYYNTPESMENFVDLKSLSRKTNNFATIYRSGSGAGDKDDLFFVLNIYNQIAFGSAQLVITFYSGTQTATLNSLYSPVFDNPSRINTWQKCQWALNSTYFSYAAGFTDKSWDNITQIQFTFYAPLKTPTTGDIFLHGAWLALPQANSYLSNATSPEISNAYYPDISNTSIYVAAWGADKGGLETLGAGLQLASSAGRKLVLADSRNYRPISSDYRTLGIQSGNVTVLGGYLETPTISTIKTAVNPSVVGAKTIGYSRYNDNWKNTTGLQRFTVGKSGAQYTTLQAAINATQNNKLTCIDFIDSAVYSEVLNISGKNLIIQAIDGQSPTIINAGAAASPGITISSIVSFYNITFAGKSADSEVFIACAGATATFYNCTFKNIGANTLAAKSGTAIKVTTASTLTFRDCLFSDFGQFVTVFDLSAITASTTTLENCVVYLSGNLNSATPGQGSSIFLYANLYCTQTIFCIGCQILQDSNSGYAYWIYNAYSGSISTGGPTPGIYFYFNETNCRQYYGAIVSKNSFWISKNSIHDINGVLPGTAIGSGTSFNAIDVQVFSGQAYCQGNIFYSISGVAIMAAYEQARGNLWVNNNLFFSCGVAVNVARWDAVAWDNNVAVACGIGFQVVYYNNNVTINGWIFSGCVNSVSNSGAVFGSFNQPWVFVNNSIVYDSPLADPVIYKTSTDTTGTQILNQNCSVLNPGLTNPFGRDFSWDYQSEIESTGCTAWTAANSILNNQSGLSFYFINFQGETGECFCNTSSGPNAFYYSTFFGFGIAINDSQVATALNFCEFKGNGIGLRAYKTAGVGSVITSCVFDDNDTAILARSGLTISSSTVVNNTYGLTAPALGLLSIKGAISGIFNISDCIFIKNSGYDYVLNFIPTESIVGSSLYDLGQTPNFTSTLLDPDYYFPAIKKLGYNDNSPAYSIAGNIGARNSNAYLTPTLTASVYNSAYVGTIGTDDNTDLFYCLENPQTFPVSQTAINPSGITFVTGEYQANPTAYADDIILKWGAPGEESKISSAMQAAIIAMYQSVWFVAISSDLGVTWQYYKVIKNAPISMEQKKYIFDDTGTAPFGNFSLHLRLIPNFNITDYTV
jgi:hypothetical protein